jgi:hypothetical protein
MEMPKQPPLTDWSFSFDLIEAVCTAYRMACDAPELMFSADERTAIVADRGSGRLCTNALGRLSH